MLTYFGEAEESLKNFQALETRCPGEAGRTGSAMGEIVSGCAKDRAEDIKVDSFSDTVPFV